MKQMFQIFFHFDSVSEQRSEVNIFYRFFVRVQMELSGQIHRLTFIWRLFEDKQKKKIKKSKHFANFSLAFLHPLSYHYKLIVTQGIYALVGISIFFCD